jgi:arabinofuranosyltransferase
VLRQIYVLGPSATRGWVAVALLVLSVLFWGAGQRASVLVDGTRYHYLDDDQMISMRYARNLAEGHGLVWNPYGERVEGYTNFGWTLVMAAVHAAGAGDARAAFWVRTINWILACAIVLLTSALINRSGLDGGVAAGGALLTLALSNDLLVWAINGFETTLLTTLFVAGILSAFADADRGEFSALTCLLAGLLPVVRSDAFDLTLAVLVAGWALGARGRWWWAVLAVLPAAVHESFRVAYYGDWLPNTYYLKVAGRLGLFRAGLGNVKGFLATYTVACVFAAIAFLAPLQRQHRVLAGLLVFGVVRVALVGPDMFPGFRFLAPYIPVLLVAAVAGVIRLASQSRLAAATLSTLLLLATVFNAGVSGGTRFHALLSGNGAPFTNTVTGVMVHRHTRVDTRLVVAAAGCVSYFARRDTIDLLGKSDRHVARLPGVPGGHTGHDRFDIDWSLRDRPDIIVSMGPQVFAIDAVPILAAVQSDPRRDYGAALVLNRTFIDEYRAHPIPVPFLLTRNALFVHSRSPELSRLSGWHEPVIDRP